MCDFDEYGYNERTRECRKNGHKPYHTGGGEVVCSVCGDPCAFKNGAKVCKVCGLSHDHICEG